MTGAQAFRADEARVTPITAAGVLAILGLSGVLAASVLQSGGGGGTLAPGSASGGARSQAVLTGTSPAVTQSAVAPLPSNQPAISTASVPAVGGSTAIAGRGVVSAGTLAPTQASGSSRTPASIAAASGLTAPTTQALRAAASQSAQARPPVAQFTPNIARVEAATLGAPSASGSDSLQATEAQVAGISATTTTGASSGSGVMAGAATSTGSGSTDGSGSGATVGTNLPFPGIQPYIGPISTQAEVMLALGLPADFQFGGEPDPYVAGSYQSFVTDAAAGDKAAQAGLDLAKSQGANFSAFH